MSYTPSPDRYVSGMKYRRAGRSGVSLPEITLGLWHNFGDISPFDRSRAMLLHAFDRGICHFDLANNYGPSYGSAEITFGKVMASDLAPFRHELFISTKAGYDMYPGPYGDGGSRKYLMNSLDQSLRRMQLDYVDIFYSHRYDPSTPLEETMQALVDIVRSGKALYAGISNYPAELAAEAYKYLEDRDVHCLLYQGKYNMLVRGVEGPILDGAAANGTGFVAFSPLAEGLLTDRYFSGIPAGSRASRGEHLQASSITPEVVERSRRLAEIAASRGQTLAQMALAWDLRDPRVTSVIIGASSLEQLDSNLGALEAPAFTPAELSAIDSLLPFQGEVAEGRRGHPSVTP